MSSLLLSNIVIIFCIVLFYRKEKQGDEAANNVCFPSHVSSVEQESNTNLDGDVSSILILLLNFLDSAKCMFRMMTMYDLISQLCFLRQFRSSIQKSDYLALRLGFITVSFLFI